MYNLQVHSCYDLLNSTIQYKKLFAKLKEDGINSVAIVDPNMYGAIKAHKEAEKFGIKIIYGLEIKVNYGMNLLTLNILCKNNKMFYKMLQIATDIKLEDEKTLEDFVDDLEKNKNDVVIVVAEELTDSLQFSYIQDLLVDFDFYFAFNESYNYGLYSYYDNILYSRASYYLNSEDYGQVVVSRAIYNNAKLNIDDLTTRRGQDYVRTKEDFQVIYNDAKEESKLLLEKAFSNQHKVVAECNCQLEFSSYHLPKYKNNEDEDIYDKMSSKEHLKYLILKGAKEKLVGKDMYVYKKRYDYELKIIDEMGFNDYFLIVYDFIKYARDNGIVVGAGRGSAAGSLVCYLLNITEADPLEYNLLFERFLNKERISMPDIDIDFQDSRRDEVIKYVENKYGSDKVAGIITFGTFQSKSAARESARILQFSDEELAFISNNVSSVRTLKECYELSENLRKFVLSSDRTKRWFKIALSLEGLPRNESVHAAGIVISDDNKLVSYTPLAKSSLTNYVTQWTMDDIEYVGLLKIDFLGIRYLTMVDNIVSQIKNNDKNFAIEKISMKDANVYNLFATGKTEGIFQFESGGMKEKLRLLKPTEFNDIVAMNALYRPGPMAEIETYVARKHGDEQIKYPHPKLEPILRETYGVIVYQEQIMLIAVNFAKMTLNEADNMRRAVSKKKKEDLEYYGKIFIEKSVKAGYDLNTAKGIFDLIVKFANYGFNKSHAVVYSMLAYRLAYLKVYYRKYFMTALLNNVINSESKINEYKQELNNLSINLVKPDVNISLGEFSVYKDDIIFALRAIKNVGYRSAEDIIKERKNFGKYLTIDDFLKRLNKKIDFSAVSSLIKAGALDSFGYNRATLMKQAENYYSDTRSHIVDVRNALAMESGLTLKVEEVEDYSIEERIRMEKDVTGTYFLKHPVQVAKEQYSYLPLKYISKNSTDSIVEVVNKKEIKTKNGDYMAFLTVNDGKGDYDVTIFPNVYKYAEVFLKTKNYFVMTLKQQIRNNKEQYILEKITTLKNYNEYCMNNIKIIYCIYDEQTKDFINEYRTVENGVKVFAFESNDSRKSVTFNIKNEQQFVRSYLEKFSEKAIKIDYKQN